MGQDIGWQQGEIRFIYRKNTYVTTSQHNIKSQTPRRVCRETLVGVKIKSWIKGAYTLQDLRQMAIQSICQALGLATLCILPP